MPYFPVNILEETVHKFVWLLFIASSDDNSSSGEVEDEDKDEDVERLALWLQKIGMIADQS